MFRIYTDFQELTITDVQNGHSFGLEMFLAFLKFCKYSNQLEVSPFLSKELAKYRKKEDFATNVNFFDKKIIIIKIFLKF